MQPIPKCQFTRFGNKCENDSNIQYTNIHVTPRTHIFYKYCEEHKTYFIELKEKKAKHEEKEKELNTEKTYYYCKKKFANNEYAF